MGHRPTVAGSACRPPCCAIAECSNASSSKDTLTPSRRGLPRMLRLPSSDSSLNSAILPPPTSSYLMEPAPPRRGRGVEQLSTEDKHFLSQCDGGQESEAAPPLLSIPCHRRRWPPNSTSARVVSTLATLSWFMLALLSLTMVMTTVSATMITEDVPHAPLSPRQLSKRAEPADISDFTRALGKRQSSTQGLAPENAVMLTMSQPATCKPLNITWDPTKGTPPFTLYVAAELWFPLSIVNIPATYADTSLRQWLFQLDLPSFKDPPPGSLSNPAIFASIVDSTGKMANTTAFMTVDNSDSSCDRMAGKVEFDSWTDGGPVQCTPWPLGWNVTGTEFRGPMKPMMFPEKQPPLALTPPSNVSAESDGTGGMRWTVTVPAGTYIIYSITDEGAPGTGGGVGGKNLVGLNQYAGTSCVPVDPVGLPTPVSTAATMLVTPDYTTQVTTTSNGAVLTVSSLVHQSPTKSGMGTGGIVGITLTIVVIAVVILLLIAWLLHRRRTKRAETHWEIPGGHSDYPKGMPIDRRFATRNAAAGRAMGATGAGMGMGGAGGDHDRSTQGSLRSMPTSAANLGTDGLQMSSPPTPQNGHLPYSDWSPLTPPLDATRRDGHSHSLRRNGSGSGSGTGFGARTFDGDQEYLDSAGVTSDSNGPFRNGSSFGGSGRRNTAEAYAMANAYRNALGSHSDGSGSSGGAGAGGSNGGTHGAGGTFSNSSDSVGRGDDRFEEVQLADRNGSSSNGGSTFARNNVVVHHDAGLLLDDSLSDDEEGNGGGTGIVELPPEYNTIAPRGSHHGRGGARRSGGGQSSHSSGPATTARAPAFHTTNGSLSSESDAHQSRTNLLSSSAHDDRGRGGARYLDDDEQAADVREDDRQSHRRGGGGGGDDDDENEKEALERRQAARAARRRDASRNRSPSPSPPSAGTTAVVDGGSVFDRARVGLGQPDEDFFWRRT